MFSAGSHKAALIVALQVVCLMVCIEAVTLKRPNQPMNGKGNGYAVDDGCMHQYDVDYLDLALSWGPGTCSTDKVHCKQNIEPKFTIHGLWPQRRQHSSPINCCTKEFYDSGELKALKNDLRAHWPALSNLGDNSFWPYEWNKHGSCATKVKGVSNVREYFEFSLKSFKKFDIEKILSAKGIYATGQNWYSGSEIVSILTQAVGKRVAIDCGPMKKNPTTLVLTQVHICFDRSLNPTDCKSTSKKCRDKIKFPRII